jgi:hypothetical protein
MPLVKPGRRSHDGAIKAPIEHQDVTTIIGLLGNLQHDIDRIRKLLETNLAKKRKYQKMTPEEWAERERTQEMVRERIAYHEAKAREEEERKRKAAESA